MNYKYEDLVVIPRSVLETHGTIAYYLEHAKPLLPIAEDAFDEGQDMTFLTQHTSQSRKQEFIKKGIEL